MAAVKGVARVMVLAGQAKPSPALGQAFGPLGVNMMEFAKDFNAKTSQFKSSTLLRVRLTAFDDRTFKYIILAPTNTWYLKRVTGLEKGSTNPGKDVAGDVSIRALYEIAKSKKQFDPMMKGLPLESICKSIIGSARSMGLKVTP